MDFAVWVDHTVKIKTSQEIDIYFEIARELKTPGIHECDGDTNCSWLAWNDSKILGKGTDRNVNKRKN